MSQSIVFFDGECNLCSRSVQFIIRRDPHARLHFCSLQSDAAAKLLQGREVSTDKPETMVLLENGRLYVRSAAALRIAKSLRFPWNLLSGLLVVPVPIRDAVYRWVASNRHRLYSGPQACMLVSQENQSRFIKSEASGTDAHILE